MSDREKRLGLYIKSLEENLAAKDARISELEAAALHLFPFSEKLAAKDSEIARLREDIKRALSFVKFDASEIEKPPELVAFSMQRTDDKSH